MRPRRRAEYLAGRFAAKEATLKALGTGLSSDLRLTEIETITSASGAPRLSLSGKALQLARRSGLRELHVSLSHESHFAIAFVVLQFGTRRIGGQKHFELKIECDPLRLLRSRR
jgi:holo-[acyl-carrier protein] synthase